MVPFGKIGENQHLRLFAVGPEDMSKGRFIFMSLLPNVVFGIIPYLVYGSIPLKNSTRQPSPVWRWLPCLLGL